MVEVLGQELLFLHDVKAESLFEPLSIHSDMSYTCSLNFDYTLSGVLLAFIAVAILGQDTPFLHDAGAAFALSCLSQESRF